jgi:hypothetical protein
MHQQRMLADLRIFQREEGLWLCADGGTLGVSCFIHSSNQNS